MRNPPPEVSVMLAEEIIEPRISSLIVNVDWLDLVEREGESKAFETLGKLKDLLG